MFDRWVTASAAFQGKNISRRHGRGITLSHAHPCSRGDGDPTWPWHGLPSSAHHAAPQSRNTAVPVGTSFGHQMGEAFFSHRVASDGWKFKAARVNLKLASSKINFTFLNITPQRGCLLCILYYFCYLGINRKKISFPATYFRLL